MSRTAVDTNVFLDVLTEDRDWADWSASQLIAALERGRILINDAIYAELSVRFDSSEDIDRFLADFRVAHLPMTREALFSAGKAFRRYRAAGGPRTSLLPDFFIGALAECESVPLLTRDARRYRAYFPGVELIAPPERP